MANSQQARRRARQAENQRQRNVAKRSMMRTYLKKVIKALDSGDPAAARSAYQIAVPIVDRVANRGLIHKNKAARHKSRLNARMRAIASSTPAP
ncbi:MAG: 30S ribosomal protein S20 [Gammaproteobacteria bacterium]